VKVIEKSKYALPNEDTPLQYALQAGPLTMVYEDGALRNIKFGNIELIRMIYAAVRDENWGTVQANIIKEEIVSGEDSFSIKYQCNYIDNQQGIHFEATFSINGNSNGAISYAMDGKCHESFLKNRIGFCVLHPIENYTGLDCLVLHTNGEKSSFNFPEKISPWQPIKTIRAMQWEIPGKVEAVLLFEGDTFEMEDQRNWTDASYKTYCTPLEKPFPLMVEKGDQINQKIDFVCCCLISEVLINSTERAEDDNYTFSIDYNKVFHLPEIGLARSSEFDELTKQEVELLREINFSVYRVDLKLFNETWQDLYSKICNEAHRLDLALDLHLHFSDSFELETQFFLSSTKILAANISSISIYEKESRCTSTRLLAFVVPELRNNLHSDILIGGGVDAYFAELNRNIMEAESLDFISYTICPQVHSFDNQTLVENIQAQRDTLISAQGLYPDKNIHISSVTLKQRFNVVATNNEALNNPEDDTFSIDSRQTSIYCAAWTLGSIKQLSENGASRINYYETSGNIGIMGRNNLPNLAENFTAKVSELYPVYNALKYVLGEKKARLIKSTSSHPLLYDGLVIEQKGLFLLLLFNYTNIELTIQLKYWSNNFEYLSFPGVQNENVGEFTASKSDQITLLPFEIKILRQIVQC